MRPSSAKSRQFGSRMRRWSSSRFARPKRGTFGSRSMTRPGLEVLRQRPAANGMIGRAGGPGRSRGPTTAPRGSRRSSGRCRIAELLAEADEGDVHARRSRRRSARSGCRRPSSIAASGYRRRTSRYRPSEAAKPKPIGSMIGSSRNGTPATPRNSAVSSSPSSVPIRSGMTTTSTPQSAARSRFVPSTLRTRSAPASTARRDLDRVEAVDRDPVAPLPEGGDRLADAAPGAARVAAEVDPVGPLGDEAVGLGDDLLDRQGRGVVDLGEDLDVERPVALGLRVAEAEEGGEVAEVVRPPLDRHAAGLARPPGPGRPCRGPGSTTRSTPSGTSRCRAIQRVGISAATVIGRTATSATKPATAARSSRTWRRANSASRPVTKRIRGRSLGIPTLLRPAPRVGQRGRPGIVGGGDRRRPQTCFGERACYHRPTDRDDGPTIRPGPADAVVGRHATGRSIRHRRRWCRIYARQARLLHADRHRGGGRRGRGRRLGLARRRRPCSSASPRPPSARARTGSSVPWSTPASGGRRIGL